MLLEDQMEQLLELDDLRVRSAELRDQGYRALAESPAIVWTTASDPVEEAIVCRALTRYRANSKVSVREAIINNLENFSLTDVSNTSLDRVPVLRAARTMQALVAAPDSAFSKAVVYCLYRIVRELYTPTPPDWTIGSARAAGDGPVTAFVTGECTRAVLGLARNLDRTAVFLEGIHQFRTVPSWISDIKSLEPWRNENDLLKRAHFFITINSFAGNIALRHLRLPDDFDLDHFDDFLDEFDAKLVIAIEEAYVTMEKARRGIVDFRKGEHRPLPRNETQGHQQAFAVVQQALNVIEQAREIVAESSYDEKLPKLAKCFRMGQRMMLDLLRPTQNVLKGIVDRELSLASMPEKVQWDANELLFAATSFGALARQWHDERLVRASKTVTEVLTQRGKLPIGSPFLADDKGYGLHVVGAEALRALAQLIQYTQRSTIDGQVPKAMLSHLEDTQVQLEGSMSGWFLEQGASPAEPAQHIKPCRWLSALSVLALERINRMLDVRINEEIFRHFSVRRPSLELDQLFLPDIGLQLAPRSIRRNRSIIFELQRMRAHVMGTRTPIAGSQPLFSAVLHGPQGTGKTTLVEALAASSKVPLVEITPSDIAVGGAEALERRSRAVFKALSLLTRVVILFDEFEPVLWRRDPEETRSFFTFLTPGMLPKLKDLHQAAKRRHVAYVLVTNLVGRLDEAATREGRFDAKIGLYYPDPLSRAGRLLTELADILPLKGPYELDGEKVLAILRATGGGVNITSLLREGWLRKPIADRPPAKTPFALLASKRTFKLNNLEVEAVPRGVRGEGAAADLEFQQWRWIWEWDKALLNSEDLDDALVCFPRRAPRPAIEQGEGSQSSQSRKPPQGRTRTKQRN